MISVVCLVAGLQITNLAFPGPTLGALDPPFLEAVTGDRRGSEQTPDVGFEGACGVALDSHSDVYVSDYYDDAVDIFSPGGGEYLTQIANEHPTNGPCGIAVDSAGDVFVNNWRHEVVRFTPSSYPPNRSTRYGPAELVDPGPARGVKFDASSGLIYIDDGTYVAEYEPSGATVEVGTEPLRVGLGTLRDGFGVAVSDYPGTQGDIYVPDAADDVVEVYDPSVSLSEPVKLIDGAGTPQVGFTYLGESEATINPVDGHLFVLDQVGHDLSEHPPIAVDEFNVEGDYRGQILAPPPVKTDPIAPELPGPKPPAEDIVVHRMTDAEPSGLAIGPYSRLTVHESDALYVSAGNSEGGAVWVFGARTIPARNLKLTRTGTGSGIVTSQPSGINCGTACAAEFNVEQVITFHAIPDAHSNFIGWSVEGPEDEPCRGAGSCSVPLFGNTQVGATFERAPQKTLAVSVSGDGTVTSDPPGISCPGQCSEEYAEGHTISLVAKPAAHTRIASWSGCSFEPNPGECKVTMSEAKSISARFIPIPPRTLRVSVVGPGKVMSYPWGIVCPETCSGQFDEGSTVYLIASSPPGWLFGGWRGTECSGTGLCPIALKEATSMRAEFVPELPFTETPQGGTRGTSDLPIPRIALRRVASKHGIVLDATVSSAGRLRIINRWLRHTVVESSGAGIVPVPLRLNGSGKAALRRVRHHRLRLSVTAVFMPTFRGTPAEATIQVPFGATD